MGEYAASGFDMGKTIEWYLSSRPVLPVIRTDSDLPHPIENQHLIGLSAGELGGLWNLFPEQARARSIMRKVVGQPATWFHRDSASGKPVPTTSIAEALSPTAIIPSYTDYGPWRESGTPAADVWLYEIPAAAAPPYVRRLILAEGFIHEVGHTLVQLALYADGHALQFRRRHVAGLDALCSFAKLAERHPPVSHYSSAYRRAENRFAGDGLDQTRKTAISEELCEAIAAHVLGFAYCGDDVWGRDHFNPFGDRPEIEDFVRDFLQAELVPR